MRGNTLRSLIYLVIFAVITLALTYVLATTISNGSVGSTNTYKAEFTDTTGLLKGDDVRVAGVRVGQVADDPKVKENCQSAADAAQNGTSTACSLVTFKLAKSIQMSTNVTIAVKYRNLVGQRYLDVEQQPDPQHVAPPGYLVGYHQTTPALDLTALFEGFKPLFQGLDPQQVNDVSYEIVASLQGEGSNLDSLLSHTASLTTSIASQDQEIGSLIDNLTGVLGTVDARDGELTNLIDQLQRLTTGLAGDRDTIAASLSNVDLLATSTTQLIGTIRPYLPTDLNQLSGVTHTLATATEINLQGQRQNTLDEFLTTYPQKTSSIIRTASYGGFFNFYLCRINLTGVPVVGTVAIQNNNTQTCAGVKP